MTPFEITIAVATLAYVALYPLAQYSKDFAGPYSIYLRGMEDCPDHESLPCKIIGNKLRKYNRTTYLYDVNISLPEAISDDIELSVAVSSFGNGGWSKNQIEQKLGPMCTAMRTFLPDSMKALLKAFGQKDCPIKPGFYVIKDFQQHTNIKWPLIPYGRYRFELKFYLRGRLVGCKRYFADSVPKKDRRPRNTFSVKQSLK